jgi:hypothetical protein
MTIKDEATFFSEINPGSGLFVIYTACFIKIKSDKR